MPLIKYLERKKPASNRKKRRGAKKQVTMSKTRELGSAIGINQLFFYLHPRGLLTNINSDCLLIKLDNMFNF